MRNIMFAICILAAIDGAGHAGGGVAVGDKAPPLTYDEWIKGDRVTRLAPGTAYLVEFWGTWCAPCVENMPRLSHLQKKYKKDGLVVIGVASHEFKGREALMQFMKVHGGQLAYRVAFDTDQSMERDWDTGGRDSVQFRMPLCFVIDRRGVVDFVGHPENPGLEDALVTALAREPSERAPNTRR
jgi:thiol-disulfide isomerase/thioredoxin